MVSAEEWEILSNDELTAKDLALKKHEAWLTKYEITNGPKCAARKQKDQKAKKKQISFYLVQCRNESKAQK